MWKNYNALPSYLGGKRKLAPKILSLCPPPEKAPVFIDAFLGGGLVSLLAKAKGYRVICNDISERSYIIGKALIENNTRKITEEDIRKLFIKRENNHFIEKNNSPQVIIKKHAYFLDNALASIHPEEYLLRLLIYKYILAMRPLGNFGARTISTQTEDNEWDNMNRNFIKDMVKIKRQEPFTICNRLKKRINSGVFDNGQINKVIKGDVFEFLKNIKGDIVYFDPPYYGTVSYEQSLHFVDHILKDKLEKSVFSQEKALEFIAKLFEQAQHIKLWIMSYGNAGIDIEEIRKLIERYRKCKIIELKYKHLSAIASKQKNIDNKEFILTGHLK